MVLKSKEPMVKFRAQKKVNKYFILRAIFSLLSVIFFFGCGYSIHDKASLPMGEIQIMDVQNKTYEPKLQDRLNEALTKEFLKHGIKVTENASYKLSGVIDTFELRVLSEKEGVAIEYEVIIQGDFKIIDSTGRSKEFKNIGSPFIVSIYSRGQLDELIALKELASDRAVRDLAMEIVANIIYSSE